MSQAGMETQLGEDSRKWNLRLYIAGDSPRSRTAVVNLRKLCERYLAGRHSIEIVDLLKNPALAKAHQIVAIPTLIRELPGEPIKRVIGDLSDANKTLIILDVGPSSLGASWQSAAHG
jgi:circadian clock protein KaiB